MSQVITLPSERGPGNEDPWEDKKEKEPTSPYTSLWLSLWPHVAHLYDSEIDPVAASTFSLGVLAPTLFQPGSQLLYFSAYLPAWGSSHQPICTPGHLLAYTSHACLSSSNKQLTEGCFILSAPSLEPFIPSPPFSGIQMNLFRSISMLAPLPRLSCLGWGSLEKGRKDRLCVWGCGFRTCSPG